MRVSAVFQKYCAIDYRGYLLEIVIVNPHGTEIDELQDSQSLYYMGFCGKDILIFSETSINPTELISNYLKRIDGMLGEREKEEEILFCTLIYKDYELDIWLKEDLSYMAWIDNFDFASWGTWSIEEFVEVIEAFRKKVDSGTGESLIHTICHHKGYALTVKKEKELYIGTSFLYGEDWWEQSFDLDFLIRWFKSDVDKFSKEEDNVYEYF